MSTSGHGAWVAVALLGIASHASAQTTRSPIDAWAQAIAEATMPRWTGQRVPWPTFSARPASLGALASTLHPVAVHADDAVPIDRVVAALQALERAHEALCARGWGEPHPDGGRGGTDGFDLYLRGSGVAQDALALADGESSEAPIRAIRVGFDAPIGWAGLDAATSFAELDARVSDEQLAPCVVQAYAEALLAQLDPAEAPAWRRATGAFLAWSLTGSFGCAEDALALAQAHPERALVGHEPGSGEAGAMLLGAVSARYDGGSGDFVREIWHAARQWTWEGDGLRGAPDVWQALAHALEASAGGPRARAPEERSERELGRIVEELAVGRWFTGRRAGFGARAIPILRDVPAEPEPFAQLEWSRLPRTAVFGEPELEPHGSAYVLCDVRAAPAWSVLRVWLRGEYGVRWSLSAVRLDAQGRELGRVRAPVRLEPRAFVPVELGEGTASVLLVVTNLSSREPDADVPDENVRGFKLVLARAEPGP